VTPAQGRESQAALSKADVIAPLSLGRLEETIEDARKAIEVANDAADISLRLLLYQFAGLQYEIAGNLKHATAIFSKQVHDAKVAGSAGLVVRRVCRSLSFCNADRRHWPSRRLLASELGSTSGSANKCAHGTCRLGRQLRRNLWHRQRGLPHPRFYGTFPRIIGHYVHDARLIPLERAIYKMTGGPAKALKLRDRGQLKEGYRADVTIFDPDDFRDEATYAVPHRYPSGARTTVIVNGTIVIENATHTGATPGAVLRRAVDGIVG
jgi:tetratricopeptide (TPR) repeat protein